MKTLPALLLGLTGLLNFGTPSYAGDDRPPNLAFDIDAPGATSALLEVRGKGFEPLKYELKADGDRLAGGLFVPPGDEVSFSVAAFDEKGEAIYKGEGFGSVDEKLTRQISIRLEGRDAKLAPEARLGSYLLTLSSGSNDSDGVIIQATVVDAFGNQFPIDPEAFDWGIPPKEFEVLPYSCFGNSLCIELPDISIYADRTACFRDITCWGKPPKDTDGPFVRVAVGRNHTCALTRSSDILCWGDNFAGQLGTSTGACSGFRPCSTTPVKVTCPAGEACKFQWVAAGGDHTCAIDTAGKAWCWGEKGNWALGDQPLQLSQADPAHNFIPAFTGKGDKVVFASIDTNKLHTCAVTTTQDIYCWGANGRSQLGFPQSQGNGSNRAVLVRSGNKYRSVSVGAQHTCAVQSTGVSTGLLDCWGENFDFQLTGNPNSAAFITVNSKIPKLNGKGVTMVAASDTSTCAENSDRDLICWGSPNNGFPVHNATAGWLALHYSYATSVASDSDTCGPVGAVCARTCVTGLGGDLFCGHWSGFAPPPLVALPEPKTSPYITFTQVDVGPNHVCSVTSHHDLWCFGLNSFGQFGTGKMSSTRTDEFFDQTLNQ